MSAVLLSVQARSCVGRSFHTPEIDEAEALGCEWVCVRKTEREREREREAKTVRGSTRISPAPEVEEAEALGGQNVVELRPAVPHTLHHLDHKRYGHEKFSRAGRSRAPTRCAPHLPPPGP